ncbi:PREDICTED: sarcoplasmic calcium-binding proteins II, V, VI, and VII-like [Priapulus caudatus]|uniref:Sarcoplasmic calcium-binding proteins II, V, VI, and VII-like n=1 Tax=Priapulus caudatus TaxID=37621 RepID=A0ABM1FA31_PRICU|nr:PREDICTED: sarcoplasmic calcium-binding proteins II, V, VI, and VII-like [Priapulus caudatus]
MTDFRVKKLQKMFHTFFDVNNDGVLEQADFEQTAERFRSVSGWAAGSPEATKTRKVILGLWERLRSKADSDGDGKVTFQEYLAASDAGTTTAFRQDYRDFFFKVIDDTGDGIIDKDEYLRVFKKFGIDAAALGDAFDSFTKNGTVPVNAEYFAQLWKEYFTSNDLNAPGNRFFG